MNNWLKTKIPFILLTSINIFWLLSSWPMNMSPDSLNVWEQVQSGYYSNDHPVTYTIFVKILSIGGRYLPLVSIVQLIILSTGILLVCFTLLKNISISMYITSIIMLTPTAGVLATTLWKDVPFVGLILIGFALLIKNIHFFGFISLALGASFRHNGWVTLLAIAGLMSLAIILRSVSFKKYIYKVFAAGILSFFIIFISAKLVDAKPTSTWLTWSPALADLAYLAARTPNDASNIHETVALFSTGESLTRAADCTSINGMIFSPGFNSTSLDRNLDRIIREFLILVKSDPKLVMRLHLCRSQAFIPPPISTGPSYFYWTQKIIIAPNNFDLKPNPPIPIIREIGLKIWKLWDSYPSYLLWPGFVILSASIFLLVNLMNILKVSREIWLFYTITMWGALVSIIPWSAAQDFRYALLSYLIAQIFIIITLLETLRTIKRKIRIT